MTITGKNEVDFLTAFVWFLHDVRAYIFVTFSKENSIQYSVSVRTVFMCPWSSLFLHVATFLCYWGEHMAENVSL